MTTLESTAELALHPWNHGYEWPDHAGPFRLVTPEQARQYDEQGFFLFEDAIDLDVLTALREAIDPLEAFHAEVNRANEELPEQISFADAITFTAYLVEESDVVRDFALSELVADLALDLIGPDVRVYHDQAVYKKPEPDREFPWHQDNGYIWMEPQAYLTLWIPLVDATLDNGCPWVLPGLNRRGTLTHWSSPWGLQCTRNPEGAVPVPAKAGSIVVFSSLTPHRTGPNTTDAVRKSWILQLAQDGAVIRRPEVDGVLPEPQVQDDPGHQFSILVGGRRPSAAG